MVLFRAPSWRQGRRLQPVHEMQDLGDRCLDGFAICNVHSGIFKRAVAAGIGEEDLAALIKVLRE